MNITNSNDISVLQVQVFFDISGNTPIIALVNQSQGANLANVSYAFVATSPTGTYIHNGNINTPDVVGAWTTQQITDPWPRPFNQIEWSGAPYSFVVIAKDSAGNIYQAPAQLATICRPNGNYDNSKTAFGIATSDLNVKCQDGRIFFQDTTYHSYKGDDGILVSSQLKVIFPIDETENIPTPFNLINYSTALVPITYSSDNYQFLQNVIYDYDQGNGVIIRIKYQTLRTFAVWCNIDLAPLVCEFNDLIYKVESGNCTDANLAAQQLNLITGKMALVFMGIQQPLIGIDVPAVIEDIKQIGGFNCNCCTAPTGIIPNTASIIDGYSFSVVHTGGDVNGNVTQAGSNIQINLHDVSYVFAIGVTSPMTTTAFGVSSVVAGDGFTKTYYLNVDGQQLALDILANIGDNPVALNELKTLVGATNFELTVDGKCVFDSSISCDYTYLLSNVPASVTYSLLQNIIVNGIAQPLSFALNLTNLSAFQTYLNTLGIGTFVVTNVAGVVHVVSSSNTFKLSDLTYSTASVNYIATLTKVCTGTTPISANQVVQNIINYLCGLTDAQVTTSQEYVICYIDPITNEKTVANISSGTKLTDFISTLLALGCHTIDYVKTIGGGGSPTCDSTKALFPTNTNALLESDIIFVTKGGTCSRISPIELGTAILQLGIYNSDFLSAFCTAAAICAGSTDCPSLINFEYHYTGTNLIITKAIFNTTPTAPQTITLLYKISTDPTYTLFSATLVVNTDGTLVAPAVIPISSGTTYNVQMINNCSSPVDGITKTISTSVVPTAGSYKLGTTNPGVCTAGTVTLYSNGAFAIGDVMYTDIGLTNPVTGYTFIVNTADNHIYNINSTTGLVGSDTGNVCVSLGGSFLIAYGTGGSGGVGSACYNSASNIHTVSVYWAIPDGPGLNNGQTYYNSDGSKFNGTIESYWADQNISFQYGTIDVNGVFHFHGACV